MTKTVLREIHIVSIVHGWCTANHFILRCLPNLLSLLSELPTSLLESSKVRIFATHKDIVFIRGNHYFEQLESLITTEILPDPALPVVPKRGDQEPLNKVYGRAVSEASATGAALIFMHPTVILAQGSFEAIIKLVEQGARFLSAPLLRTKLEATTYEIDKHIENSKNSYLSLSLQELAALIFRNWHPINDLFSLFPNQKNKNIAIWKPYIIERTGENEVLLQLFQGVTFFAWPHKKMTPFIQQIDRGLVDHCCNSKNESRILLQNDGFLACDLCPEIDENDYVEDKSGKKISLLHQFLNLDEISRLQLHQSKNIIRIARSSNWSSQAITMRKRIAWKVNPALYISLIIRPFLRLIKLSIIAITRFTIHANGLFNKLFPQPYPAPIASTYYLPSTNDNGSNHKDIPEKRYDFTTIEHQIYTSVTGLACGGAEAIVSIIRSIDYLKTNNITGAFVECGVFRGANIIVMMKALLHAEVTDRDIFLYDTFSGMPEPDEIDVYYDGQQAIQVWQSVKHASSGGSDWVCSPIEEVRQNIETVGYPMERITFVEGLVEDTIPETMPSEIALLRLDTDFYKSTKHELTHLFPRLKRGGILIIDDYGAFAGSRAATDEYFKEAGIAFFLGRVDEHVRIGVKL